MVTAEELAILTAIYSPAVVAAFVEFSRGKKLGDVMQALYELAQRQVVEDPQQFGLEVRPC